MDVRVGLIVLLVFAGTWMSDTRNYAAAEDTGNEVVEIQINLCTVCEQSISKALNYLKDEEIQDEILGALHKTCSDIPNFGDQCKTLVDEFAKTFFSEVSSVKPQGLCKKVGLCRNATVSSLLGNTNKCDVCHLAVAGALNMLNDPDNELGIILKLLKACNAVGDKYKSKCKRMVFEYGPIFLTNAGIFVEKLDVCITFHACTRPSQVDKERVLPGGMIEMVTSS
ncbi:hypothetical protein vseg_010870 [Gypsophila vaccaria]